MKKLWKILSKSRDAVLIKQLANQFKENLVFANINKKLKQFVQQEYNDSSYETQIDYLYLINYNLN